MTGHAGRLLVDLVVSGPVVSRVRLADALWSERPPASADAALRVHLTRLRRLLDDTPLTLERRGSALELVGAVTDIDCCERSVRRARDVRAASATWGELDEAAAILSRSANLWRGQPFSPYDDDPDLATSVNRVQTLRAEAEELAFDIDLDRGRHGALIADLERAVANEPFREGAWARLMVALYRDGRQRDALERLLGCADPAGGPARRRARSRAPATVLADPGPGPGPRLEATQRGARARAGRHGHQVRSLRCAHRTGQGVRRDRGRRWASIGSSPCADRPGSASPPSSRAVVEAAAIDPVIVDLDRVASPGLVPVALAEALGLRPDPSDGIDPLPLVHAALAEAEAIVVLDGGDRLGLATAAIASDLLGGLPLGAPPGGASVAARTRAGARDRAAAPGSGRCHRAAGAAARRGRRHASRSASEAALERVAVATDGHPLSAAARRRVDHAPRRRRGRRPARGG